jgi:hypothetical protein
MLFTSFLILGLSALSVCDNLSQQNHDHALQTRSVEVIRDILKNVENHLDKMATHISHFRNDPQAFELFEQESAASISAAATGVKRVSKSPAMGIIETVTWSLVPYVTPVADNIDKLLAALGKNKTLLLAAGLKHRVIRQLKQSRISSDELGYAILANMAASALTGPLGSVLTTQVSAKWAAAIEAWEAEPDYPFATGRRPSQWTSPQWTSPQKVSPQWTSPQWTSPHWTSPHWTSPQAFNTLAYSSLPASPFSTVTVFVTVAPTTMREEPSPTVTFYLPQLSYNPSVQDGAAPTTSYEPGITSVTVTTVTVWTKR